MDRRVFTFQNISSTDASDEDSDSGCSVRISDIQLYSPHGHAGRDESARYISRSSSLKTVKVPATRKNNSSRASFNCCRDNQELTISNKTELIKTHSLPGINFPRTNTNCDSPQMRPLSPTSKVNSWRSGLPLHNRTSDQNINCNSEQPSTRSRRISMRNISTENSEDKTKLSLECLYPVLPPISPSYSAKSYAALSKPSPKTLSSRPPSVDCVRVPAWFCADALPPISPRSGTVSCPTSPRRGPSLPPP